MGELSVLPLLPLFLLPPLPPPLEQSLVVVSPLQGKSCIGERRKKERGEGGTVSLCGGSDQVSPEEEGGEVREQRERDRGRSSRINSLCDPPELRRRRRRRPLLILTPSWSSTGLQRGRKEAESKEGKRRNRSPSPPPPLF